MEREIFEVIEKEKCSILKIKLKEPIEPSILKRVNPPVINYKKGLIISGRAPIWLYGFLIHYYHPTPFIGIYDPRLGVVIIQSHVSSVKVGEVMDVKIDEEG
ncbi:MAG: CRISPR-associated ring nuclease Crn3/Csx3 [Dictyoglomaceae bacterium]|nr:CRISPR-associated ring nuclease Crn3/Csx3 [Dictyoglomaceae bacterium]